MTQNHDLIWVVLIITLVFALFSFLIIIFYGAEHRIVTVSKYCTPPRYSQTTGEPSNNASFQKTECEMFCEDRDMICFGFNGKDCNVVTKQAQFYCQDQDYGIHIFLNPHNR